MATSETEKLAHRTPVQKRSEVKRSKILHMARMIFAERGFEAANLRDIATAAETTHSMIRYHFGTKEQLWREAVRDMFRVLDESLSTEADDPSKPESALSAFKTYLARYIRYCAAHPEHARIMIMESARGSERLDWIAENCIRPRHEEFARRFAGQDFLKSLPEMTPISFIYILTAVCQIPFVLAQEARALYGVDTRDEEVVEQHIQSVLNLFFQRRTD